MNESTSNQVPQKQHDNVRTLIIAATVVTVTCIISTATVLFFLVLKIPR
jgi:hypothetical protein